MARKLKVNADNIAGTELAIGGIPVLKMGKTPRLDKEGDEVEGGFNLVVSNNWAGDVIAETADGTSEIVLRGIIGIRKKTAKSAIAKAVGEIL